MVKQLSRLLLFVLLILAISACGGNATSANSGTSSGESGKLKVVATTGQIADAARIIGGDHADVAGLMGPGIDPHLYVASEGDVGLLQEADIIFYNGLFLEAQMTEVMEQLGERKTVTAVAEKIDPADLLDWAQYADQYDPHVWFDVALWSQAAEAVRDTYVEADPENAADYQANAEVYLAELAELDSYVQEQADRVPTEKRVLITAHDAFHYFGRAYGFDVRGLQGISTATEAGTADVRDLATFIVEQEIPAIFVETSVPVRNIEALQAAVADRGFDVEIGGHLFSDALGDAESGGETYIKMVQHNIDTIVSALLEE